MSDIEQTIRRVRELDKETKYRDGKCWSCSLEFMNAATDIGKQ